MRSRREQFVSVAIVKGDVREGDAFHPLRSFRLLGVRVRGTRSSRARRTQFSAFKSQTYWLMSSDES